MTDHSTLIEPYRRMREAGALLNNSLVKAIPKTTLDQCARLLGFLKNGTLSFETDDEMALLMDYCLYYPLLDGKNLVAKHLKDSPPAGSAELAVLRAMTRAYYSLFQVVEAEMGVGVVVEDLLRDETGFIVDVGYGSSADPGTMLATRVIPADGFLMTTGAGLPVDDPTATRISKELTRIGYTPEKVDFKRISPWKEAEVAATIIRECRASGMSSRIRYAGPNSPPVPIPASPMTPVPIPAGPTVTITESRRVGRNERCPCGSGKKFKVCCGRQTS